jgi:hypothetical protein
MLRLFRIMALVHRNDAGCETAVIRSEGGLIQGGKVYGRCVSVVSPGEYEAVS